MKLLLSLLFCFNTIFSFGQTNDTTEIIQGPEKYKKEVIGIYKYYDHLVDSLDKIQFEKMAKDSNYYENERKTRPKKYLGYDGGSIGYLTKEQYTKIKNIIDRFLKIDRLSGMSYSRGKYEKTKYSFYYDRTVTDPDGTEKKIHGKVLWFED